LELQAQAAALEANLGDLLRKQRDLQKEINDLTNKAQSTKQKIIEKEEYINQLIDDYKAAMREGNTHEIVHLAHKIDQELQVLSKLKDQYAVQTNQLHKSHEDLVVTNQKLHKLGDTYQKMIELELAQVGI